MRSKAKFRYGRAAPAGRAAPRPGGDGSGPKLKARAAGRAAIPRSLSRSESPILLKSRLPGLPYRIHGRRASDLEWRCYQALKRLGHRDDQIEFQVDFMGGRQPGGQVLDFVVWPSGAPVAIAVNGDYWHARTLQLRELDRQKEAYLQARFPSARFLALYTADLLTEETAYQTLLREVGRG